jgi:hypothetical protein
MQHRQHLVLYVTDYGAFNRFWCHISYANMCCVLSVYTLLLTGRHNSSNCNTTALEKHKHFRSTQQQAAQQRTFQARLSIHHEPLLCLLHSAVAHIHMLGYMHSEYTVAHSIAYSAND